MQSPVPESIEWLSQQVLTEAHIELLQNMLTWHIRSLSPTAQVRATLRSIHSSLIEVGQTLSFQHIHGGRHLIELSFIIQNLKNGRKAMEGLPFPQVAQAGQDEPPIPDLYDRSRYAGLR